MSLLSSFFKSSKKTSLTPDVGYKMPSEVNPQAYRNLSSLANRYINNQGTGFGEDFVNQTSNPIAASMRRNFQNVTAPTLSSNYSSRGLGRSSLAANAQGLAQGNVESDIGNMMAQFYQLNEAQKKTDVGIGANLSQNLLSGDVNAQGQQAAASERLANATNADAMARQGFDTAKTNQFLQAGAQLVAPSLQSSFTPQSTPATQSQLSGMNLPGVNGQQVQGSTTKILGASNKDFEAWLASMFGG